MNKHQFALHAALEDKHWWFVARRAIVGALLAEAVAPSRELLVTEIGMGTGGNLKAFSEQYRCIGIEVDGEAVRLARERVTGAELLEGDALTVHVERVRAASAVLLMDVIEYIEHDREFLHGVIGLMQPGDFLLITVPACPWLWSPHVNHLHFGRYMPDTLRSLWQDEPIEERLVSFFNSRTYPLVRMIHLINRRTGRTTGDAGTDLKVPPNMINCSLERIFRDESRWLLGAMRGRSAKRCG